MRKNRPPFVPFRGTSEGQGQTLLEVLAALGVGVVVLVAIVSVVLSSLSNAQFSKNQNLATQYAQQGMEIVRDLRNRGWNSFYNKSNPTSSVTYCLPSSNTLSTTSGPCNDAERIDNTFKREVIFQCLDDGSDGSTNCEDGNKNNDKIRITATVSFTDSKGEHKSELISVFTNWNQ